MPNNRKNGSYKLVLVIICLTGQAAWVARNPLMKKGEKTWLN